VVFVKKEKMEKVTILAFGKSEGLVRARIITSPWPGLWEWSN